MAKLFKQHTPQNIHEQRYNQSRTNLLLVVIFTAINLVFLITNADTYFLFSAFIPYFIAGTAMLLCGRFPAEYYTEELEGMTFLDSSVFAAMLAVSAVLTLLYLLAWFKSKKSVGWLVIALVLFILDTLGMFILNGISADSIVDILFHIWVVVSLILGIHAHKKMKALPPEEAPSTEGEAEPGTVQSPVLRVADPDAKHRVLLETQVMSYTVCYRRVKHTNELVINGNVYDVFEGIVEPAHTLTAVIDGHRIEASYNGIHSILSFDGEVKAKKLRLY